MNSQPKDDEEQAEYLILLLTDSNLPTGGFVASSGLESYHAHGLLTPGADGLLQFIRLSLETYTNSSAGVFLASHHLVTRHLDTTSKDLDGLLTSVDQFDNQYHTLTLNHVAQRASKAQGIALLTLFTKSFATSNTERALAGSKIISQYKSKIRADRTHGHLPICWAVFTACLGISARRALQVHLFLQVRAIISSAIRLNIVGPYLAHRLLAFNARKIIDDMINRVESFHSKDPMEEVHPNGDKFTSEEERDWSWTEATEAKMTWPLGDLVQARHDQLHSRLFNS